MKPALVLTTTRLKQMNKRLALAAGHHVTLHLRAIDLRAIEPLTSHPNLTQFAPLLPLLFSFLFPVHNDDGVLT
jgi:hypothetical protein